MNFMNTKEYWDIVSENEMLDEIAVSDPISPFDGDEPDFDKNVWDGEKFVTEAEYNTMIEKENF